MSSQLFTVVDEPEFPAVLATACPDYKHPCTKNLKFSVTETHDLEPVLLFGSVPALELLWRNRFLQGTEPDRSYFYL